MKKVVSAHIRCTKCAHNVTRFVGYQWKPTAGYMHFRNFYPDATKLLAEAEENGDAAAYCCQCAWTHVTGATMKEINTLNAGDPAWVNI